MTVTQVDPWSDENVQNLVIDGAPHNGRKKYRESVEVDGVRKLLGGQQLMIALALTHHFAIFPVGRRTGKSTGDLFLCMEEQGRTPGMYYHGYVAPDHPKAREAQDKFIAAFGGDPRSNKNTLIKAVKRDQGQDRWVETYPIDTIVEGKVRRVNEGGRYYFWSGEGTAGEHIRGFMHPYHRITIDEAKDIPQKIVTRVVLPMLTDVNGKLVVYGTPGTDGEGNPWFKTYFTKGQKRSFNKKGWVSRSFPSEANPKISLASIKMRREACLTKDEERQEYDAAFLEDAGAVFSNLNETFCLGWASPRPAWVDDILFKIPVESCEAWVHENPDQRQKYVLGADWAKKMDAGVISVFNVYTGRQAALFRFWGADYEEQLQWVKEIRHRYNKAMIHSDAQGVGAGMTERLGRWYGEGVVEHAFNSANKKSYVRRAQMAFRGGRWSFIACDEQKYEFETYRQEITKAGNERFTHLDGEHDDFVDAAMMVCEDIEYIPRSQQVRQQGPIPGTMDELLARMERRNQLDRLRVGQI